MGDETAISLGKHPERIRLVSLAVVVLLAGMAVSLVGPVSFIGLMVPHVIRGLIGKKLSNDLTFDDSGGGILVILADWVGRIIQPPLKRLLES